MHVLSRCEDGYEPATKTASLSCQSDGTWSKHSVQCRPAPCRLPTHITPHLLISGKDLTPVGGTITLSCLPGFYLQGSAVAECRVGNTVVNDLSLCRSLVSELISDLIQTTNDLLEKYNVNDFFFFLQMETCETLPETSVWC